MIDQLKAVVGAAHCLTEADARAKYETDVTGQMNGTARAVLRPGATAEVAEILKIAQAEGCPVVPMGGNTGLAGGGYVGDNGHLVLSLERMNRIREINPTARIAKVEAGVILQNLHDAVEEQDLVFPLMFGARGSCTIGGNLATNAGGSNVVRYGNTRALVLGVEAVLADGTIIQNMSELHKDNTGYDLRDLLIGSEGTLGVITAAVLKLVPRPKAYATGMVKVPEIGGALSLLNRLQAASGGGVEAFEYMPKRHFDILSEIAPELKLPFAEMGDTNIFIEVAATRDQDAEPDEDGTIGVQSILMEALAEAMEDGSVLDAAIAQNEGQRADMWRSREMAFEVAHSQGKPIANDVALPLDQVDEFLTRADARLEEVAPGSFPVVVGHLGDGNLHYTIVMPGGYDDALKERIVTSVEDVVAALNGSFSAEHGIGVAKLGTMARRKDPGALSAMRAIKAALDPKGILNPGKLLP